ncbi:hypothetical protein [Pseudorhodoferax sp. Leaf267]|uniref:hypothetical protein n=1 Tax=Pseudorhodoferax sp. Leaf267 TaxID=1736316 RepID=UPI00138F4ACC|nr:hypothetical protein [Pseudorhodoferax sp. Leaf267]
MALLEKDGKQDRVIELRALFDPLTARAKPLLKIRNKTVAHIDAKETTKDFFAANELHWHEVRAVLDDTIALIVRIADAKDAVELGIPPDGRLRDATFHVLATLRTSSASQPARTPAMIARTSEGKAPV